MGINRSHWELVSQGWHVMCCPCIVNAIAFIVEIRKVVLAVLQSGLTVGCFDEGRSLHLSRIYC